MVLKAELPAKSSEVLQTSGSAVVAVPAPLPARRLPHAKSAGAPVSKTKGGR